MSGSSLPEREQFLLGAIGEALDAYERGDNSLAQVVTDVENGIDGLLEVADTDCVEELRSTWSGLEIIYALALDESRSALTDEELNDIGETIAKLRSQIAVRK